MEPSIANDQRCFCCGQDNERGLKLVFAYPGNGKAETQCVIPEYFTGWRNTTHGGFLAMLLDETMAHACLSEAAAGVTVEMKVRYLKPVATGQRIRVSAEVTQTRSRIIETRASITTGGGDTIAQGSARFLKIS
jgi:uncharacterized protein (TIGR00369 family)